MTGKKRFIIILTVIVGFALMIMIISRIGSGTKKDSPTKAKTSISKTVNVTDYADKGSSKVVLTIGGRINGDDQHRSIRITVDSYMRTAEIIQGYEDKVIQTQTAVNNPSAYEKFIFAISRYGFSKERKTTLTDDRGVCPLGQRFVYEIYNDNNLVMRRWATTCGSNGTTAGSPSQLNTLFQRQVTDYSKFVNNVQL